ncbi:MAG: M23 family metallopeptidase [Lachnospiraceae bacterium]|nr:M23 family metallopeptidase [Lachnospiraceae bacterium]
MKRRRKNHKRERMIMLCSSVLVLTALTATGIYVKEKSHSQNDGYVVDLSELENEEMDLMVAEDPIPEKEEESAEVSSTGVEKEELWNTSEKRWLTGEYEFPNEESEEEEETEEVFFDFLAQEEETLSFSEEENLLWPVVGNVLINYSMEKPVYFSTLEQYKLSPAIVISAKEGQNIHSAARGKVTNIEKTAELGNVITMDIGSGYEIEYGQLTNIQVKEGDLVEKEDYIADVGTPTKYYSLEGDNVYFSLKKDGQPVNPMTKLR